MADHGTWLESHMAIIKKDRLSTAKEHMSTSKRLHRPDMTNPKTKVEKKFKKTLLKSQNTSRRILSRLGKEIKKRSKEK